MSRESEKFIELLKPVYNDLARYCRSMCRDGNPDLAEDVFQETLLKGLVKLHTLKDEAKFKNWMFSIATRTHRTSMRARFWKRFLPLAGEHLEFGEPVVYSGIDNDYRTKILFYALSKLKEKEKTAILLFEIGGFPIRDIMEIQKEKSESAVKSRLSRTREKLSKIINETDSKKIKFNPAEGDLQNETIKIISGIERKRNERGQLLG